ncbi:MAG: dipeptidase [Candidatus Latescibacteria bacterium]|nr:dipeptidase [Candidatus Latescibacterota bacterium]
MVNMLGCSSENDTEKKSESMGEQEINTLAQKIHKNILTLDTHDDIEYEFIEQGLDLGTRNEKRQVDLVKMEEGGLDAVFFAVWTGQKELNAETYDEAYKTALKYFDAIHNMCKNINADKIDLALSPDDVVRIWKSGKKVGMIGVENGFPIGEDISRVKEFYDLGARYITITHMGYNQLGDSSDPHGVVPARKYGGLTDFGKDVIREMNRLGMMVDVSHVARDTFYDIIFKSYAPVIASHSGCRALCNVPRNLDDYQLQALKDINGVVQIVAYNGYVKLPKEEADIKAFVDHIDHAVEVAGIDYVGIGADFDGGGGLPGFEDASKCLNVTTDLVRRGYSRDDIEKIWGGNLLRVWRDVEKASGKLTQTT